MYIYITSSFYFGAPSILAAFGTTMALLYKAGPWQWRLLYFLAMANRHQHGCETFIVEVHLAGEHFGLVSAQACSQSFTTQFVCRPTGSYMMCLFSCPAFLLWFKDPDRCVLVKSRGCRDAASDRGQMNAPMVTATMASDLIPWLLQYGCISFVKWVSVLLIKPSFKIGVGGQLYTVYPIRNPTCLWFINVY